MTDRSRSASEVVDAVAATSRRLVNATRTWPASKWNRQPAGKPSPAEVVTALVRALARLEHAVEVGSGAPPDTWRDPGEPPYPGALPDRLAVVGHDLVAALRAAPPDAMAWYAGELVAVDRIAVAALRELEGARSALAAAR